MKNNEVKGEAGERKVREEERREVKYWIGNGHEIQARLDD